MLFAACFFVFSVARSQEVAPASEVPAEFQQGVNAFKAGQVMEARRIWSGLLERHPTRPELLNNLAVLYSRSGDSQKAAQLLAQAATQAPFYASIALNWRRFKAPGDTPQDLTLITEWPLPGLTVSQISPGQDLRAPFAGGFLAESLKRAEQRRLTLVEDLLAAAPDSEVSFEKPKLVQPTGQGAPSNIAATPDAELERALAMWVANWKSRNVPAYLNWYAADFTPASGMSRADWRRQRESRLTAAKQIELAVQVTRTEPGPMPNSQWLYTVQRYKSPVFQDVSNKSMLWVKTPDGWRILRESSGPPGKGG